jgi:hypothetical protein
VRYCLGKCFFAKSVSSRYRSKNLRRKISLAAEKLLRTNDHYGIPGRQFVSNVSKARVVSAEALANIKDAHVRMS